MCRTISSGTPKGPRCNNCFRITEVLKLGMMDVENHSLNEEEVIECKSEDENDPNDSDDDVCVLISPLQSPLGKSPCTPVNGHNTTSSPQTPRTPASTNSKKRKRLSSKEREEREKDREDKRARLEEEKQRKEDEKNKREQERLAKLEQKEQERLKREEEKNKREEEKRKKQEELEKQKKQREEERKKKQEEDEKRKKEKEDERRQKEEEKKKKLEEEEKRKKEKEEERLKKLEEREQERIKREQERLQKLEEKEREKKKDEEKIAKQAKMFTSFFQKSPGGTKTTPRRISLTRISDCTRKDGVDLNDTLGGSQSEVVERDPNLFNPMMFEVKSNMILAPVVRRQLTQKEKKNFDQGVLSKTYVTSCDNEEPMEIESNWLEEKVASDYLKQLKLSGGRRYKKLEQSIEADVQIVSHTIIENPKAQGLVKWRYKLLQFHTNNRPAYWGTWKKRPITVRGRNPFKQEKEVDYEFDSDDEWEGEPEDGEELGDSEKEDDPENAEEEDDEDGWLVPHGYISDDEGSVDEHLDKETLKMEEKNYFEGLKKQIKIKLPEIQTCNLSDFRIILSPLSKKWKETCSAKAAELSKLDTKDVIIIS
ncbi:unnamed protein product [Allacma fusca]|uniref:Chromatin assembly factor 1 subunit A dimerization domain-containing protein n=1 Tax=Allacma fusca TaxID=39272 RepID=A0A8J2KLF3_9HEXA|nr:unnamed protein product [Allacma fusca]